METLTIELTNPKSRGLLQELEVLQLIRVLEKEPVDKPKLSTLLRGSISADAAAAFNELVSQSRDEWERGI